MIVLLHGQPDVATSLWPLRSALQGRFGDAVSVLALDRPGYGTNTAPATDFDGNARWLEGVLSHRDRAPVIVVGHSWAGGVALTAAARGGADIAGIVLLAS